MPSRTPHRSRSRSEKDTSSYELLSLNSDTIDRDDTDRAIKPSSRLTPVRQIDGRPSPPVLSTLTFSEGPLVPRPEPPEYLSQDKCWPAEQDENVSASQPQHGPQEFSSTIDCQPNTNLLTERWSWTSISLLLLSLYSFCASAFFLIIAILKPRYGRNIAIEGSLSPSTATVLTVLVAKTIDLAFVALLVAIVGQVLTHQALAITHPRKKGITTAELSLRYWLLQPGLVFTQGSVLKYSGRTILGAVVLISTFASTLYTTASEALVSAQLRPGPSQQTLLSVAVFKGVANASYQETSCYSKNLMSAVDASSAQTCAQIDYAARSVYDLHYFHVSWSNLIYSSAHPSKPDRLQPLTQLLGGTSVVGQWMSSSEDITVDSSSYGRLVQNVTMAMPHANVVTAAQDLNNALMQPWEFSQAECQTSAAVPVPVLNVPCIGMSTDEILPMIYDPNSTVPFAANTTAIDDIFGFGNLPDDDDRKPRPLFPKIPIGYNMLPNYTVDSGPSAVYLLGIPPKDLNTTDHFLCSLKMMLSPDCSTRFSLAATGGDLSVHCNSDPENDMPYTRFHSAIPDDLTQPQFRDMARSLVLGGKYQSPQGKDGDCGKCKTLQEN